MPPPRCADFYDFEAHVAAGELTRETLLDAARQVILMMDHLA